MDSVDLKLYEQLLKINHEYNEYLCLLESVEIMSDNKLFAHYLKKKKNIEPIALLFQKYQSIESEIKLNNEIFEMEKNEESKLNIKQENVRLEVELKNAFDKMKIEFLKSTEKMQTAHVEITSKTEWITNFIPNFIMDKMDFYDSSLGYRAVWHPTFLYESLMNLLIVIFMYVGRKYIKKYYVGDSLGVYLIGYGIVRFIIETLRTDPLTIGNTGIKIATLISVLFVILGVLLLVLRRVFKFQLKSCHELFYTEGQTMVIGGSKEEVTNE